jgi:peptide/nickel transport system permease protein
MMRAAQTDTADTQTTPVTTASRTRRKGRIVTLRRGSSRFPWLASIVILLIVLIAVFGPMLSRYGQFDGDLSTRLVPPLGRDAHGGYHVLGTDDLGRDVATRLMYGARVSLLVSLVGVALACVIGTAVGLLSGVFGFVLDTVLMRLTDVALSIPGLLLAVLIASVFRPSLFTVFCAVGLLLWPTYARLIRGEVLVLKTASFVDMARVSGCSTLKVLFRHLLPNVAPSMMVLATLQIGAAIIIEASISFLGVGLPPNEATWGSMINAGRVYLNSKWGLCVFPGLCIFLAVTSFNAIGDWARIRFDPRLKAER